MDRNIEQKLKAIQHQLAQEPERLRTAYDSHILTHGGALCGDIGRQERNPDSIESHQEQLISNMDDLCDMLSRSLDKICGSRPMKLLTLAALAASLFGQVAGFGGKCNNCLPTYGPREKWVLMLNDRAFPYMFPFVNSLAEEQEARAKGFKIGEAINVQYPQRWKAQS